MIIVNPIVPRARGATVACALWIASASALALSDTHEEELEDSSIDALKIAYLWCDQAAATGRLPGADIMRCSVIYEELKQRAFGGDFERLLAWSRANPSTLAGGR